MAETPSPGRVQKVCVAQIGAPHGVRGEVRLKSFTGDPLEVARYGPLETEDGAQRFEIAGLRPAKDVLIARLKGVVDRNAAEALCNVRLYLPRSRLPAPEENEFYYADLVGLAAIDAEGRALGTIVGVHNFGAGDLLEIAPAVGGATVFIPFTREAVPVVELSARRIVVDAASGLMDSE
jgi:16S rRNA processing protein RimM